ncbi:hypothetical protein [Alteribacillus persepolensis]|uniref:hypothetical protein n=1 Tax=Alteribacillus persepolensis TaxID=568899 RepID=UPI00158724D7|nr:hypothetical protein [Alteribacillus persepolensis]
MTPTEIVKAYENGADIVKIFPAAAVGAGGSLMDKKAIEEGNFDILTQKAKELFSGLRTE